MIHLKTTITLYEEKNNKLIRAKGYIIRKRLITYVDKENRKS